MYYGWIGKDNSHWGKSSSDKSEKRFDFWSKIIIALICMLFATFLYFSLVEGDIKGYSLAKFEGVSYSETSKGEKTYYVSYDVFGTKVKEDISGSEYANLNKNQPEYVIVGLYETKFKYGNKIRLGLPNDGGYTVEKFKDLVDEGIGIIESRN